ncbi:hypothetical protein BJX66DRAFT_336618 [Aspergillus keveii]|uniref:F-box domain-containing protein n=1 Tax=Aspergillus keveii TaxID=714993 RepID=A0ABR4GAV6_9EURO
MEWDELGLPATVENFAYYRLSLVDHTLDSNSRLCPVDNGRHISPPKVDLGALDKLPQELLETVLGQLDIQSLTKFRRFNRRGMQAVDSIHAYKQIVTRFPTALRAILSINTGATYSCQDLYHELQTAECRDCGRFGGFLYLLTCRRLFDGDDVGMTYTAMMFDPEDFEEHVEKHVQYEDPYFEELFDELSSDEDPFDSAPYGEETS